MTDWAIGVSATEMTVSCPSSGYPSFFSDSEEGWVRRVSGSMNDLLVTPRDRSVGWFSSYRFSSRFFAIHFSYSLVWAAAGSAWFGANLLLSWIRCLSIWLDADSVPEM